MTCPFCDADSLTAIWSSSLVIAIRDQHPVNPGHTLVIARRHIQSYFDATENEQREIWRAVADVKAAIDAEFHPDGYNIGFNAGVAAGQTVLHLHVHIIPRFKGDQDDPRGGVRGVIPSKQKYEAPHLDSSDSDPFADILDFTYGVESHLVQQLHRGLRLADRADLLAAFVQLSGVQLVEDELEDALTRGAKVRVLTGDYLGITDPNGLQQLYALATAHPSLAVRFFEAGDRPFHPKAYIFRRGHHGVAFVGSSNLSRTALTHSVEWNLRATSSRQATTFTRIVARFEALWENTASRPLTAEVVAAYQSRVRVPPAPEPPPKPPTPNIVQSEVLKLLAQTREEGARRGLVVMATGLGKTYLAAFDLAQMNGKRLLFVAHREEILEQAERAFSRVFPDRSRGVLIADRRQPNADLLFGSVQTLSRIEHLLSFDRRHFDYIVIDEFHHAAAPTYQRILGHFEPTFLLGLTATPDRTDGASLLEACDDNLVARVGLVEGITRRLLVPFHYFGVKDDVDYAQIPWRSGRFDEEKLTAAVATRARAEQALREYHKHAPAEPRRTLAFCVSQRHADFMADFLRKQGIHAVAVHSGPTSAHRAESLARFRNGDLEVLCAVDVFNEGLDVPDVNIVLMLRPTESPIVFLQQLGRGLRRAEHIEKGALTVVDFIGNHRSFLRKPQALLALTGQDAPPGAALRLLRQQELELPSGCSVDIETEALDLLERVSRLSKDDRLVYEYVMLRDSHGHRPSASEVFTTGVSFEPVRQRYGTWHDFVLAQGDLADDERSVLDAHRPWFRDLLVTQMTKSFKMVAIEVMLDAGTLTTGIDVPAMAERAHERIARDAVLRADFPVADDFVARWRDFPLSVFHAARGFSSRWFRLDGDRFESNLKVAPALEPAFRAMTAEIVDLRLREYKTRHRYAAEVIPFAAPITMRVSHSGGNPILRFDRTRRPDLPDGDVEVLLDNERLTFSFRKIAVNVAYERPGGINVLPSRMRRWFGPSAGLPGTRHEVQLERVGESWRLRPLRALGAEADVIPFRSVPFFKNLRVACGTPLGLFDASSDQRTDINVETSVTVDPKAHFVVRAEGDSMDGGAQPIRDGDLVLCEWLNATRPEDVEGKICLLAGVEGPDLAFAQIKIPIRKDDRWFLRSANPRVEDQSLNDAVTLRPVARVIETVQPALGLSLWGTYDRESIARQFGGKYDRTWQQGHVDRVLHGKPHSVLLVTLHKTSAMASEYHYADRFLSPTEFQWESQNQTSPEDKRGTAIREHSQQGRTVHLFVRFHGKAADSAGEPFVYCGPVDYVRHQGANPMQVWFRLQEKLPQDLYRAWTE